jgi:RNA polymerase sigma-70 factor (ECF subfamily)
MTGSGDNGTRATPAASGAFTTTHWSVVLAAAQQESPQAAEALETLCRTYWYPLYAFVRCRGHSPEDAQDLTQEFFAHFLQKGYFHLADRTRGRFRTFLVHALEHFLINEWKRGQRIRRGGGRVCFSLDATDAETRYLGEAAGAITPERYYDQRWAMTLLDQVMRALRQEYAEAGRTAVFEELADFLWGKDDSVSYTQIGERLGMTEGALRGAMHRLRRRYRERLRAEVAQTVAPPDTVEDELRYLLTVVSQ